MKMTEKHRKALSLCAVVILILFFLAVTVFLSEPILSFFEDPKAFRAWVEEKGWGARGIFVGVMVLQILVALIPGEPLEIAAGIAFGGFEGTLLVMAGVLIGSTLVFLLVRNFGVKLVEVFFSVEKIRSLHFLQNSRRVDAVLFLIMLIPGTPKDLISYFVGLTEMKLGHWLLLSCIARIPSILTSTIGGNAIGEENYWFAAAVFAVTAAVSGIGVLIYDRITKKNRKKEEE